MIFDKKTLTLDTLSPCWPLTHFKPDKAAATSQHCDLFAATSTLRGRSICPNSFSCTGLEEPGTREES